MITLRQGTMQDLATMEEILAECGMLNDICPSECLVAEEEGRVAGFARIEYAEGVAYLRPIITARERRRRGIGRQLLSALVTGLDELRIVARGEVAGFYQTFGFRPISWDSVYASFCKECAECPDRADCKPLPMIYRGDIED